MLKFNYIVFKIMIRIGIDIGGAFTDLISINDENGEIMWNKVETTQEDPAVGVINAIKESQIDLSKVSDIVHGQTLAINTVIERKGSKVGLITTKGFGDILEIQRANRRDMYNFKYKKPQPFVPRYLRLEINERINAEGEILKPINEEEVIKTFESLEEEGIESIAVSLLNSYVNPYHELEVRNIISKISKNYNIEITLSHEITREWKEYERTNTAVLNAYILPKIKKYILELKSSIDNMDFKGNYFAMLSNGGAATFDFMSRFPITTLESGPIAGIIGAMKIGELTNNKNIIAMDGGSTTTKASLIMNLEPNIITDYYIERSEYNPGYPVKVPTIDIVEIGNGGTSIAWIDDIGELKVGPKAAGSFPGPSAYGKGGIEPTVTDAYIVNGMLNQESLLGGKIKVNKNLAEKAISKIADKFKVSINEAAEGIIKIANNNAVNVIRLISVQRGYDPRDFTLIAYGGSGPMFAPFISEELDIRKIVIPFIPAGVFSAWGMLISDIKHNIVSTNPVRVDNETSIAKINDIFQNMESNLRKLFSSEGFNKEEIMFIRNVEMRYYGQEHTVKVNVMSGNIGVKEIDEIIRRFKEAHERTYGFNLESEIEIINFFDTGIIKRDNIIIQKKRKNGHLTKNEKRRVFINGNVEAWPVLDKDSLISTVEGPAIIEDPTSTIIVLSKQKASIDDYGNVIIER